MPHGAPKERQITNVAVLHGSDVRPQAAVSRGQDGLHAGLQLVERHGETGEVVHLQEESNTVSKRGRTQSAAVRRQVPLRYRGGERRPGVYPPQQSASWNHGNRLLDLGHVVGVVVVRSVHNILQGEPGNKVLNVWL